MTVDTVTPEVQLTGDSGGSLDGVPWGRGPLDTPLGRTPPRIVEGRPSTSGRRTLQTWSSSQSGTPTHESEWFPRPSSVTGGRGSVLGTDSGTSVVPSSLWWVEGPKNNLCFV